MQTNIIELMEAMIDYDKGDARRTQHFLKVHQLARFIGIKERLDSDTQTALEAAALVHDIGIHLAEEQFGRCDGKLQEALGPEPARQMLQRLQFDPDIIERVCYLVGHHHTYSQIDGLDYQILVEADFLVNLYEDGCGRAAVQAAYENIFRTESGRKVCESMYGLC